MTFREISEDLQERVNEILMDSTLSVVVEGEHDILVYEGFLNEDYCHLEEFNGKENAMLVIEEVNKINSKRAIAILDKDLDAIKEITYPDNVFLTDAHDIDTQMFLSDAFYRVAKELYTSTNTRPKKKIQDIRNLIISIAQPLSYMRIASDEMHYGFAFKPSKEHPKPFAYKDLVRINRNDCTYLGDDNMIGVTCRYRNQGVSRNVAEIKRKIEEIRERQYADELVLHGHDLMNVMGLLVLRYGASRTILRQSDEIEQLFRLTYYKEFKMSILYQTLKEYSRIIEVPFCDY